MSNMALLILLFTIKLLYRLYIFNSIHYFYIVILLFNFVDRARVGVGGGGWGGGHTARHLILSYRSILGIQFPDGDLPLGKRTLLFRTDTQDG